MGGLCWPTLPGPAALALPVVEELLRPLRIFDPATLKVKYNLSNFFRMYQNIKCECSFSHLMLWVGCVIYVKPNILTVKVEGCCTGKTSCKHNMLLEDEDPNRAG
jgi:hypothetical protein